MFPKESAFTRTDGEENYLEGVRKRALSDPPQPRERPMDEYKLETERQAARQLLEAAADLCQRKEFDSAVRLIHEARDILDNADPA